MKITRAAVLLLVLASQPGGSDARDDAGPGLRGLKDPRRGDPGAADFNAPPDTSKSSVGTLTVGGFSIDPATQPFAAPGTLTLIVDCPDAATAEDAAGGYDEPVVIKRGGHVKVVNVPVRGANAAYAGLSAKCTVTPDEAVHALPYESAPALQGRRLQGEEEPYGIEMVLEDVEWWNSLGTPPGSSKVCVVDTGYGNGHEDLPTLDENSDGHNPQSSGEWYVDGHSHGTHCAGTIGALGGNSKGVVGVIPGDLGDKFSFFIGKGLSDSGSGSTSSVMSAVQACVDAGSNVISMSLGGGGPSDTVNLQYYGHYKDDDVLIIAAAGNGGNSALSYPASYKSVMSVAAVDSNENKAGFSQYNEQVEIAGPGVSVKSTITGNAGSTFGYASYSGTSMATPHVAGVAGLLRMHFPDCKAFQIRNAMILSAQDKGDAGCDTSYGFGIVKAKAAYDYLTENACDPNEDFKEPEGGCAEYQCSSDSDCDDGNPDTINTCQSGTCVTSCASDAGCDDGDDCTTDTCTDGVCANVPDPNAVEIKITTDNYPGETSWKFDFEGETIAVGEEGSYSESMTLHTHYVCVAGSGLAAFTIYDAYGDGICCSYGAGEYAVNHNGDEKASGGEFASEETTEFQIDQQPPGPTPPPVTPPPTASPVTPPPTPSPITPTNPPVTPPPTPSPVASPPTTDEPTFRTCSQWNAEDCTPARGCQWTGDCQNCGCHPCLNWDCADQVMANLEKLLE